MKIETLNYEQLPQNINKESPSDNGSGKEYASYLLITHDDGEQDIFSDAMEPEDARFYRDLSWISDTILKVYTKAKTVGQNVGFADGYECACDDHGVENHLKEFLEE